MSKTSMYIASVYCLTILSSSSVMAAEQATPQQVSPLTQTESWLALQREGEQASPNKQTLSGPAMDNIHKRYLDSFTRPIPERFDPGQFNNTRQ
ncbi:DUF3613 domain-containing protein [Methylobacillus gramineus]|uniref:DUF3613 domain-containing protein n=1 Tax=Methylobacillus gramineus TaxID=755169 RepID=UPI001CFF88AA|nr:DUF3613 domain-containing protein [Methylobacillus gramineus]MCB5184473.1 DUF3613 domain-containing protein [Methylobacillus gramineus]